jgi:hypothetical protein
MHRILAHCLGLGLLAPHYAMSEQALLIKPLAEKIVSQLSAVPLFWRIENFATRDEAPGASVPFRMPLQHAQRPQRVPVASLADTGFHVKGKATGVDSI